VAPPEELNGLCWCVGVLVLVCWVLLVSQVVMQGESPVVLPALPLAPAGRSALQTACGRSTSHFPEPNTVTLARPRHAPLHDSTGALVSFFEFSRSEAPPVTIQRARAAMDTPFVRLSSEQPVEKNKELLDAFAADGKAFFSGCWVPDSGSGAWVAFPSMDLCLGKQLDPPTFRGQPFLTTLPWRGGSAFCAETFGGVEEVVQRGGCGFTFRLVQDRTLEFGFKSGELNKEFHLKDNVCPDDLQELVRLSVEQETGHRRSSK
jgi:hypothetical protein